MALRKLIFSGVVLLSVVCSHGAQLSGSVAIVPVGSVVNLTSEGKLDWIHWGLFTDTSLNRKATTAPKISDFKTIGSLAGYTYSYRFTDNANGYTWSDGMSALGATNSTTGVWAYNFSPEGSGFELTVPASTNLMQLKLYVGAFNGRGRLTASLSDGSAAGYSNTSVFNSGNGPSSVYSLTFAAGSSNQVLTVRWTLANPLGSTPNVTLQAAALTAANANNPPHTTLLQPAVDTNVSVGTGLILTASANDPDGTVAMVEFYANETLLGTASTSPYELPWSIPGVGRFILQTRAVDNLGGSSKSRPIEVFAHANSGTMSGSLANSPLSQNLTVSGDGDWLHCGFFSEPGFERKSTGARQIRDAVMIGNNMPTRLSDYATSFDWSDGTSTLSFNGSRNGIFVVGWTNGFELTAPADLHPRTLCVYVGLYGARGLFKADLSDASAPAYIDQTLDSVYNNKSGMYAIQYAAAAPGQTLRVRYIASENYDEGYGNIALAAATLTGGPTPVGLQNARISGNNFTFVFATASGVNYIVDSAEALNSTNWHTLATYAGNGTDAEFSHPITNSARYFRLRLE